MEGKVYIVILNWNGVNDTLECMESVFRNHYSNYKVIVCDNNSSDRSMEKIKAWAERKRVRNYDAYSHIARNTMPPLKDTISYIEYDRQTAENGGDAKLPEPPLILIQTGDNLGFAGGNNVGIRYALKREDFTYIWLLNNDTVVEAEALVELVNHYQTTLNIGICGSKLLTYEEYSKIQSFGGRYNKYFGTTRSINTIENIGSLSYISGASMLISKKFLHEIGLMNEEYFLYYEEMDWAVRSEGKFVLGCAERSVVYHKEGATIGGKNDTTNRSEIADYYSIRNRILFSRKYFSQYLPLVYLGLLMAVFNRIKRKQYSRVKMIFDIVLNMKKEYERL